MIREIELAKKYLHKKFSNCENIPDGNYPVPVKTSKGKAYMKVQVQQNYISGMLLFWDKEFRYSWYKMKKPKFKMIVQNFKDWLQAL